MIILTILEAWNREGTIKGTARQSGTSVDKVSKELSSLGVIINDTHKEIMELYKQKMPIDEISNKLKISPRVVARYLPRVRPEYNVDQSENALKIKKCREKKRERLNAGN